MSKRTKAEPQPVGRPTIRTEGLIGSILARIADGESVRSILRAEDMPARSTWHEWLLADTDLQERYALAKDLGADAEFDELLEIADDGSNDWMKRQQGETEVDAVNYEHIARSKLRVDARKWRLARLAPKKYGERLEQVHTDPDGRSPFASLLDMIAANGRPRPGS